MSVLMRAREITGRPVVTLDGAEAVAEVKDVVITRASAAVVGFTLNKRGSSGRPSARSCRGVRSTPSAGTP